MKGIHFSSQLQGCCNHQFNGLKLMNLTISKKLRSVDCTLSAAYNAKSAVHCYGTWILPKHHVRFIIQRGEQCLSPSTTTCPWNKMGQYACTGSVTLNTAVLLHTKPISVRVSHYNSCVQNSDTKNALYAGNP
jgi:hypothetical protein